MPTSDPAALFPMTPPGSVRETKVFGFRGEYGCKAET
ncbi:unnamed protein product [Tetraodon nigroviridis]|uniref:(spotted green pufferfish) hypothetical protein n=1 Tax=Tetraodon nigroviridis TaxID=99883 RepID=Q4TH85_TETNG|nr:unnamed protein product [Tetraodon nigroviridis]